MKLTTAMIDYLLVKHGKGDDGFHAFARAIEAVALAATAAPEQPTGKTIAYDPFTDTVYHLASPQQQPAEPSAWISVEDRLPPNDVDAIILFWPYDNRENAQMVGQGHHIDGVFYNDDGDDMHPPSHWIPLPAPPVA